MTLKDLFQETKKEAFISKIDMVSEPNLKKYGNVHQSEPLQCSDTISWFPNSSSLTVKLCRQVLVEMESDNGEKTFPFKISVESTVQHYLKESCSLDAFTNEDFKAEIAKDMQYYAYAESGIIAKVSLLISEITFAALGVPVTLPPMILNVTKE